MPFVDETLLEVASGHGGAGAATFRREKYVPKGGPDGGDGGRGGDVVFVVKENLKTLAHLANVRSLHAEDGHPGQKQKKHGKDGRPVCVEVPPGTTVSDAETGKVLKDLSEESRWVFLRGGAGGRGNTWFKSATRRTPRYAQPGKPGERATVRIELRLIADVGFVGMPNAGKSTLLSVLTNAHPEIAAYPFTTRIPNLGVLKIGYQEIVLADIPGIIEGAAEGAGLGDRFLKHVTRAAALALVVDLSSEDPVGTLRILLRELERYDRALPQKRRFVVGTKTDLPGTEEQAELTGAAVSEPFIAVSAHTHEGLSDLLDLLKEYGSKP